MFFENQILSELPMKFTLDNLREVDANDTFLVFVRELQFRSDYDVLLLGISIILTRQQDCTNTLQHGQVTHYPTKTCHDDDKGGIYTP